METMASKRVEESPAADIDIDYATVFDDQDFLELFLAQPKSSALNPTTPSHHQQHQSKVDDSPHETLSSMLIHPSPVIPNGLLQQNAPSTIKQAPAPVGLFSAASASSAATPTGATTTTTSPADSGANKSAMSYLNIVMLVDPVTDQVTLPKQDVIAGEENKVVTIGPTVLSNFSQIDFSQLVASMASAAAANARKQEPVMNQFVPISPASMQVDSSSSSSFASPSHTSAPSTLGSTLTFPSSTISNNASNGTFHTISPVESAQEVRSNASVPSQGAGGDSYSNSSSPAQAQGSSSAPATPAPLRALSAYNFFFRDERDRIIHGGEIEWTKEKQNRLLHNHWNQDRTKKRRHRKSHGKIDFSTLSKLISSRWKDLPEARKEFYRQIAAQDWDRFQRELAEYKHGASVDAATSSFASFAFSTVIG